LAVTTALPIDSAAPISVCAGSSPPISSTTTSMSGRGDEVGRRVGHETGGKAAFDGAGRIPDGHAGELEGRATLRSQRVRALEQGPDHLAPHRPRAEDGDAEPGAAHAGDGPGRDIARMVADRSTRPPGHERRLHSRR
jgi:hypothetical protein